MFPLTIRRGSDVPTSKLKANQVREMHRMHAAGDSRVKIAERFDVSPHHVGSILKGRYWEEIYQEMRPLEAEGI